MEMEMHYHIYLFLSWTRSIQSISPHFQILKIHFTTNLHLRLGLPSGS